MIRYKKKGLKILFLEILLIVIGFVLLVKGADYLVRAAASIAKKFGLSEMIIGLTIVAIGTSLPEVFITIKSSFEGRSDLIIGNAIGSSICNFLLVIGLASVVKPIKVDERIIKTHIPIGIASMILLIILGNTNKINDIAIITKWQGVVLLICTIAYVIYTIYEEKFTKKCSINDDTEEHKVKEEKSFMKILLYMTLGILGLKFGSDFVVDNAIFIAERFGLSESVISMTIIACGTALPEIVTGIMASWEGESDLILGNIAGSNILNLCLLIGIGAVINPLIFSPDYIRSIMLLIIITVVVKLIAIINKDSKINRTQGLILILIYVMYIINLFR